VLLAYFWLTSSTTVLASDGRYKIVSVGKGIASVGGDDEEESSDIYSDKEWRLYLDFENIVYVTGFRIVLANSHQKRFYSKNLITFEEEAMAAGEDTRGNVASNDNEKSTASCNCVLLRTANEASSSNTTMQ